MTEYDKIAKDYAKTENIRLERTYIIDPSFIREIGNVKEKTILDLGCGDGNFTRKFKKMGAKEVFGVDISKEMIRLAEEKTKNENLEIKYLTKDIKELGRIKEFDIISAPFLLHYSKTKEELLQICNNIYINLKENGRLVTMNNSDDPIKDLKEFGAKTEGPSPLKEGDKIIVKLYHKMKEKCSFTTYYWSKKTYEDCIKKAGFKNIKWINLAVSEEGLKKYPEKNWKKFIKNPYLVILTATK